MVIEGIYSMDGDFGNLQELLDVADVARRECFHRRSALDARLAANMVAELRRNSASKTAFRLFTAHFQKRSERWADFVAGSKETLRNICVFTRIRMFIRARCRRS